MNDLIKKVTKATDDWYDVVRKDCHKDKDCHWYIDTVFSYGKKPKYYIRHYGYILDEIEIECESYEEALVQLLREINEAVRKHKNREYE